MYCKNCSSAFDLPAGQPAFLESVAPRVGDQQISIPAPSLCPECRLQRRLAFRNPIHVVWRQCDYSRKPILSAYVGDVKAPVIDNSLFWGDSWDALAYGRAVDFQKPFFPQFLALRECVPYAGTLASHVENCNYCSNVSHCKDCYLVFNTKGAEDCVYCDYVWNSRSCIDCTRTIESELCYGCVECLRCYNLQSSEYCDDCSDSLYLSHCRSCRNCIGCVNLVRKEYCVFNQQLSRTEFEHFLSGLQRTSFAQRTQLEEKLRQLVATAPHPHLYGNRVEEVSGNFIYDARRVDNSYFFKDGEDCNFNFIVNGQVKSCYDYSHFGGNAEALYECQSCGNDIYQLLFCRDCWDNNSNLIYCASCFGCQDCFGCVGLRKKQYCVLNQQLDQANYHRVVASIITHMQQTGEWGEFFPMSHSPFPYNLSFANRYFPLSESEAQSKSLRWQEKETTSVNDAIAAAQLPDELPEADEPITVISSQSARAFRITPEELSRYRQLQLPLPRQTYDERMEARWSQLGGVKLYSRRCAKTGAKLLSTHAPDVPYPIWDRMAYEDFRLEGAL